MTDDIRDVKETTCCIVGGGPGGAVLSLLLARKGIPVMLLEAHKNFEREFRGDTIHPSVLEIMDEIGLANRLHQLPHAKIRTMTLRTVEGPVTMANFSYLKIRYPYIMMLPQSRFLEFIIQEAEHYPQFQLVLGANVQQLVEGEGVVRGVRYRADDGWHEVRALLTVGADGRFSHVRSLAGFKPIKTAPPMDILWFRLPRKPEDAEDAPGGYLGRGQILVLLTRPEEWQIGFVFPKGEYQKIRAAGIESLRRSIVEMVPWLSDRVEQLQGWQHVSVLSVESSRVSLWYRPGLILIGDAAHVMSPVGGVGINYAIQDAVVAANVLSGPLQKGQVQLTDLAAVQQQRQWPTRIIQAIQAQFQKSIVARVLDSDRPFRPPLSLRILPRVPILRHLLARLVALGVSTVHVRD